MQPAAASAELALRGAFALPVAVDRVPAGVFIKRSKVTNGLVLLLGQIMRNRAEVWLIAQVDEGHFFHLHVTAARQPYR